MFSVQPVYTVALVHKRNIFSRQSMSVEEKGDDAGMSVLE